MDKIEIQKVIRTPRQRKYNTLKMWDAAKVGLREKHLT